MTSLALGKPQSCSHSSSFGLSLAGGGRREAWRSGVSTTIDLNSRSTRQVQNRISRLIGACKKGWVQLVPVMVLLMSWAWPFFTYWGPMYIRRSAFITTYQDTSIIKILTKVNETTTVKTLQHIEDPLYVKGGGINWGICRMWFWMISMFLFAKNYCDFQVHPAFHAHMTQSGMIFYIMHRCFTPILVQSFYNDVKLQEPTRLWLVVSIITYALCLAFYFLFISNKYTRMMFGLLKVQ